MRMFRYLFVGLVRHKMNTHDFHMLVKVRSGVDLGGLNQPIIVFSRFVFSALQAMLPAGYRELVEITSGVEGAGANHPEGDAVDFVVPDMQTNPKVMDALGYVMGLALDVFPYASPGTGAYHFSFVWRTFDGDHQDHVHLQAKKIPGDD